MTVTAEQAKAMLDAATPGIWEHGVAPGDKVDYLVGAVTGVDPDLHVVYQQVEPDRHIVMAITGDGPTSNANAALIAAAPDLAATVVELHERLGSQTEQSSALQSEVDELRSRLASVEAERDELQDQVLTVQTSSAYDLGHQHGELTGGKWKRERDALQAAIDKALALHRKTTEEMLDHKCANEVCEHEDECPSILVDVCGCCAAIAQQVSDEYWPAAMDEITWPCPTYVALTQGGEGS
jgi:hypothetical protein